MSDLAYINEEGHQVFKSEFHKKRGYCCKANCLHCPFGTTHKNLGFVLQKVTKDQISIAEEIMKPKAIDNLTDMMLSRAFNTKVQSKVEIKESELDKFYFVYLKDHLCAVVKMSGNRVLKAYLKEHFENQGITEEVIESHLSSTV